MTKLHVCCLSMSLDGYCAGPDQDLQNPLGVGGTKLHEWVYPTRTFCATHGKEGGETGINDDFAARGFRGFGAWILGRNMFGPVRGPWPDESWKGWWGDTPPYHCDVFVLTHHARKPLKMDGGTTFHFVTDGIQSAYRQAKAAAKGQDIRLGGGASTIQQYLAAKLIDEMHVVVAPTLLGQGEPLFGTLNLPALGYACREQVAGKGVTHVILAKRTA
jgi:dihydrofolate reductase